MILELDFANPATIGAILLGILLVTGVAYKWAGKGKIPTTADILFEFIEDIAEVAQNVISTLYMSRDNYKTEDDFKNAVAIKVLKETKKMLLANGVPEKILNLIDDKEFSREIIRIMESVYDNFMELHKSDEAPEEEAVPINEDSAPDRMTATAGKTDISPYLDKLNS